MRRNVNVIRQTRLMAAINDEFGQIVNSGAFATAIVATFFSPSATLSVSVAGHPPPLLYRRSLGAWTLFADDTDQESSGPRDLPLGVTSSTDYGAMAVKFEPGDFLLAYTDAFIEARNAEGELLQTSGLPKLVNDAPQENRSDLVPWLVQRLRDLSPDNLQGDDGTLILLQPTGRAIPLRDNLLAPWRLMRGVLQTQS